MDCTTVYNEKQISSVLAAKDFVRSRFLYFIPGKCLTCELQYSIVPLAKSPTKNQDLEETRTIGMKNISPPY